MQQVKFKKAFQLIVPILFLSMLLFTACEKEVEKIVTKTVHDTTVVVLNDTTLITIHDTLVVQIISVDTIFANPDSISQGGSIQLTAQVSTLPIAGEDLMFFWDAEAGTFNTDRGDTVIWKAPDEAGVYKVSVHVTDGEYIAIGKRNIGVGVYAASITPYYVGGDGCVCHSGKQAEWANTAHAHAWESLQNSGHAASYCNPCHTVGYEGDFGNSGYDEAPITKFVNVQCENCHGPGSDHISGPSSANITVSYNVENCGKCHNGEHHPYQEEWEQSPHNFDPYTSAHGAATRGSCGGCHEGVAAAYRLSGDLSTFYGGGAVADRPDTTIVPIAPVVCSTCHDPHSDANPGQLRTVDDVVLVTANNESPVITVGGTGKLCMQCHHARRAPETQVANGYAHFGPHANPQADMMAGKSAYHAVADPSFVWAGPSHLNVQNSCKTCHLPTQEYAPGSPAVTGHKFEPTVEACANCHGAITSFDDIMATDDYDGDGTVEGVQSEVHGLVQLLQDALIASGLDTTGVGFAGALGDTTLSTVKQREAGYNMIFIEDDKSWGIHNPDYAIQLLQQSYQYLTGTPVPNAKIARQDDEVVSPF
ncbi:MAG: hypothetical protein Kow0037_22480 [Calditrichia bacterium]